MTTCNALRCGQILCVVDAKQDTEVSSLVNMTVYTAREPQGKVLLASISATEPKIRIYQEAITQSQGKMTSEFAALNLTFSQADESSSPFACEVYYEDTTVQVKQIEKIATQKQLTKHTLLLKLGLETNSSGIVNKVDTVSKVISDVSSQVIIPDDAVKNNDTSTQHDEKNRSKIIVGSLELQRTDIQNSVNTVSSKVMETQNDVKFDVLTEKQRANDDDNARIVLDTEHQGLEEKLKTRTEHVHDLKQEIQQVFRDDDTPYLWANVSTLMTAVNSVQKACTTLI